MKGNKRPTSPTWQETTSLIEKLKQKKYRYTGAKLHEEYADFELAAMLY